MYKLTARTIEYKPGDSVVRKNQAWNLEGDCPQELIEMIGALVSVDLMPPSIAEEIPPDVIGSLDEDEIILGRIIKFYGVGHLMLRFPARTTVLTVEIPPFASFYTFEPVKEKHTP
jgi:hypothetical protein